MHLGNGGITISKVNNISEYIYRERENICTFVCVYIYIYKCVCICMCVCININKMREI